MTEPIISGEAVPVAGGVPQDPMAGVSEQQPSTIPTPQTTVTPQPKSGDDPKPQGGEPEPDYKALYEQSERRRAGLDKRLSQFRGQINQQTAQPNGDDPDAEINDLRLFKAEAQLKEEAGKILDEFKNIPDDVKAAIKRNPRGWIKSSTTTVDDAVFDLEDMATELDKSYSKGDSKNGQPFKVAQPNASVPSTGKPVLDSIKTPEQMDLAIQSGQISEQDLADEMRRRANERVNPQH